VVVALTAVGIALVLVVVTRGRLRRVLAARVAATWTLVVGAALQVASELWEPGDSWGDDVGFGLVLLSYLLLMVFVVSNLHLRGMGVVLVGLALNALVIGVNQGMPVRLPDDASPAQRAEVERSAKHHVERGSDHLVVLADIIPIPASGLTRASFGDLILAVGFIDVVVQLARPPRRRTRRLSTTVVEAAADDPDRTAPPTHRAGDRTARPARPGASVPLPDVDPGAAQPRPVRVPARR
jgi:hypothetical protein